VLACYGVRKDFVLALDVVVVWGIEVLLWGQAYERDMDLYHWYCSPCSTWPDLHRIWLFLVGHQGSHALLGELGIWQVLLLLCRDCDQDGIAWLYLDQHELLLLWELTYPAL
jgi:hypothetical protein